MQKVIDAFFYVILALMSLMLAVVLALLFRNLIVFGGVKHMLACVIGLNGTWFCVSMWMWAQNWKKLDEDKYWRFISGPRPPAGEALSAWRWGRQVMYAWLGIMGCILLLAAVLYWSNG